MEMEIFFPEEIKWELKLALVRITSQRLSYELMFNIDEMRILGDIYFSIGDIYYPQFIEDRIKRKYFFLQYEFIRFEDPDELGLFPPGFLEVMCSSPGDDVDFFMPLLTFFRILLNISEETYSLRKQIKEDRESCPKDLRKIKDLEDDWYIEMEEAIKSLKKHIEDNKELWEKQIEETRQNKESIMKAYLEVYGY